MTMFLANEAMVNIDLATAGKTALMGYAVVFFGLVLLMAVIMIMGKIMVAAQNKKKAAAAAAAPAAAPEAAPVPAAPAAEPAPGSAGELKLHDVDPRTAALLMAIVADKMGKPINELRFKSIKEVK